MSGNRSTGSTTTVVIVLLVIAAAAAAFFLFGTDKEQLENNRAATFLVEETDLIISVKEAGTLQSADPFEVKSAIEGSATILALAAEGSFVEAGDLLVELDASELLDERNRQEINFAKAEASRLQAEQAVEIQKSLNASNIARAELTVDLAKQDLEKYVKADYLHEKKTISSEITLAKAELERAREQLDGSVELAQQGYISELERKADELTLERRRLDLELAEERQQILINYDHDRQIKVLRSDLEQSEMELGRTRSEAIADLASQKADLAAKISTFDLEERRLERISDQISKAKVYAPKGGLVVYATISQGGRRGGDNTPIEVAASIRERQLILSVTDSDRMLLDAKIHESSLDKVRSGQPVRVTVDAIQGIEFRGVVEKVALLPDSQNMWLNPDLKVYSTRISLNTKTRSNGDADLKLRPGMSCTIEIICSALEKVLGIPLQAVHPKGSHFYCYVLSGDGKPVAREVSIGLHNERMVHITSGIEKGERVFLSKPPGASDPDFGEEETFEMKETIDQLSENQRSSEQEDAGERFGRESDSPTVSPGSMSPGSMSPESMSGGGDDRGTSDENDRSRRGGRGGRGGFGDMSDEDKQKMMERFKNMTDEEKAKFGKGPGRDSSRGREDEGGSGF